MCYIIIKIWKISLSLMMALNERYPSAWHMLIERLIKKNFLLKVVYRWVYDILTTLEWEKLLIMKGRYSSALRWQ